MNVATTRFVTTALGVIRVGVGLSSLARPQLAYRTLGVRSHVGDGDATVMRMFGIRDAAIAAATLSADAGVRATGLRLGALADIVDVGAVIAGRRSGVLSRGGSILIGGAAAIFAAAGAAAVFCGGGRSWFPGDSVPG